MVTQMRAPIKKRQYLHKSETLLCVGTSSYDYGSTSWESPIGITDSQKCTVDKSAIIQNECSRVVAGAYKATRREFLHAETMVSPMQEYFDHLQAKARTCSRTCGQANFIRKHCKRQRSARGNTMTSLIGSMPSAPCCTVVLHSGA